MPRQFTIRGVLQDLLEGRITLEKAENLLQDKIRRTGYYAGSRILADCFQDLYNEVLRRIENDENVRIDAYANGGLTVSVKGTGNTDNRDGK